MITPLALLLTLSASARAGAPSHLGPLAGLDAAELTALATTARTWPERLDAAAALAWQRQPEAAQLAWSSAPDVARNGQAVFVGDRFRDPAVGPVVLDRLRHGDDPADHHEGLAHAAVMAEAVPWQALPALLAAEPDAGARAVLLGALEPAPVDQALASLAIAARDADAEVRAAALRILAGRQGVPGAAGLVLAGAQDPDPQVRAAAAQAVGWLDLDGLWGQAQAMLADPEAAVRIKALRALERLDPERAAALPQVQAMASDPDPRAASIARQVVQGR